MKQVIVRLTGAVAFLIVAWLLLSISMLIPFPGDEWSPWSLSAIFIGKFITAFIAFMSLVLSWTWLTDPPKEFLE